MLDRHYDYERPRSGGQSTFDELKTCRALYAALIIAAVLSSGVGAQECNHDVDKTIELTRRDGKIVFIECGNDKVAPIVVVVGQRVRWENRDREAHAIVSTLTIAGRPLFGTGVIEPGDHSDLLFDIDLYQRAGGRPANVITLEYRTDEEPSETGELRLLSAARR